MENEQKKNSEKDGIVLTSILCFVILLVVWGYFDNFTTKGIVTMSLILSLIGARIGRERQIGFVKSFFACFFLSPLIGFVIILVSKRITDEQYKARMLQLAEQTADPIVMHHTVADQLLKLNELRKEGILTDSEFQQQKEKLLNAQ